MANFTPGPWKAIDSGDNEWLVFAGELTPITAVVVNSPNAHLIAAAPEMYVALKKIAADRHCCLVAKGRALAAIAKAEGKEK